jgi:hypothetical protein
MNPSGQESQKMGRRGAREEHNRGSKSSRQAERQNTLKGLRGDTTKPMQGENEKSSTKKGGTSNEAQQNERGNNMNMQRGNESNQRGAESNRRGTESTQRGSESNEGSARMNGGSSESRSSSSTEVRGGGSVHLSEQQRTEIKMTVIEGHNAPRVGHVDFDVRVGTEIPRGKIHVVPVPETLVRIEPQWRGFLYFVYEDEVVIVDPHDYKIVAVVPV